MENTVMITAELTTRPDNKYLKIYSSYGIETKLTGDFIYKVD